MILIFCEAEEEEVGGGKRRGDGSVDETGLCDDSLLTFVDLFTSAAVEPQSWKPGSDLGCMQSFHWISLQRLQFI